MRGVSADNPNLYQWRLKISFVQWNAKAIRVDATNGQILAVQTERPEDQAEEPPKTH